MEVEITLKCVYSEMYNGENCNKSVDAECLITGCEFCKVK